MCFVLAGRAKMNWFHQARIDEERRGGGGGL